MWPCASIALLLVADVGSSAQGMVVGYGERFLW